MWPNNICISVKLNLVIITKYFFGRKNDGCMMELITNLKQLFLSVRLDKLCEEIAITMHLIFK